MKKKKLMVLDIFGQKWLVYHATIKANDAGRAWLDDHYIEINNEIPINSELFQETLIHELLHAVFERCSFKQSGLPMALEEVMIDQIAKVVTENFKLVKR